MDPGVPDKSLRPTNYFLSVEIYLIWEGVGNLPDWASIPGYTGRL